MRIALFLEAEQDGTGGFQQALSVTESLIKAGTANHEIVVFTRYKTARRLLLERGIEAVRFRQGVAAFLDRYSATAFGGTLCHCLHRLGLSRLGRFLDAQLEDHAIDLVFFASGVHYGDAAYRIGEHPFIATVWDTAHRDHPDYPEIYRNRKFAHTEQVLSNALPRALAVICDSPSGARRVARLYDVAPHRIIQLPFTPALAVRQHDEAKARITQNNVRFKYRLPESYVFYPAFPAVDKNHLYLLEALATLRQRHAIILSAVFCGGGTNAEWATMVRQVEGFGLAGQVRFLGLVPDEDIPELYKEALALVMPTDAGPTNLPPLEAVWLNCPVIYSDLPEFREQMGDAALYCELTDPSSLADELATLIQDPELRGRLQKAASRLAGKLRENDYCETLVKVFDNYAELRRRWAWPGNP